MREPLQLYDAIGIPLEVGDMIRVFHFKTKVKNYWMYKRVIKDDDGYFMAEHYPFGVSGRYGLQTTGNVKLDVIIVASEKHCHDERKRFRPKTSLHAENPV